MDDFERLALRLTPAEIAAIAGVHPTTARRWKRTHHAPTWAARLLALHVGGALPTTCPTWTHWRINGSYLIDPAGIEYSAGQVMTLWAVEQLRRDLEQRHRAPVQYILDV